MKYNININQLGLDGDKDISLVEASIIDWVHTFCGTSNWKINANKVDGWTLLRSQHLITDMPLLRIKTRAGGTKLLHRLAKLGYIEIKTGPRKLWVKPTLKMDLLYVSVNSEEETVNSGNSNCKPQEHYHNTNNNTNNNTLPALQDKEVKITEEIGIAISKNVVIPPLKEEKEFNFAGTMYNLEHSKRKIDKIIHLYLLRSGLKFETYSQYLPEFKKNLYFAKQLEGYSGEQIDKTILYVRDKYPVEWKMSTICKYIAQVVNNKV